MVESYQPDFVKTLTTPQNERLFRPTSLEREAQLRVIGKEVKPIRGDFKGYWGYVRNVGNAGYEVSFPQVVGRANIMTFPPRDLTDT
jgi:transcription elongation factor